MVEKLLKHRSDVKKRKPNFRRQQINQYAKFARSKSWKRPKGHQAKMRLHRRGHRAMPSVGYGSPKLVRGFNKLGFKEVVVCNMQDLLRIDAKTETVVISRTVGNRKRLEMLKHAKENKIKIVNVSDVEKKINEITKVKSEKKAESLDKKNKKAESSKKKAEKVSDAKDAEKEDEE